MNYRSACFLLIVLAAMTVGCAEYNQHVTGSESESLISIVQLTAGFDRASDAHFSKDMRWIVFQAIPSTEQQYQTYVAKLRYREGPGSAVTGLDRPVRISPVGSRNGSGSFSPDGLSLIFSSTGEKELSKEQTGFRSEMDIFRADGWEGAVAMADPVKGLNFAQHPLTDNANFDGECSYSPDGKFIAFTSNREGDLDIYVMHSDGTHLVRITASPGYDGGAYFSPDGKNLVYRSDRKGDHLLQIFLGELNFDSRGEITGLKAEHQLTNDANVNWGPFWHPDGKHIVYSTNRDGKGNYELYLMNRKGEAKTRLTFSEGADVLPSFSPDGKYVMWSSGRSADKTSEIYVAKFEFPEGS